jgi:hypothetical protein
MAAVEFGFLQGQLDERKRRLELAVASAPGNSGLADLLREVDSALDRMAEGTYGLCLECRDSIEQDRLLADPLVQYCLDHLTPHQRTMLERDLNLASQVQRNLLPQKGLRVGRWDTSYHFEPVGPVSGDYCDLIQSDGQLLFMLGDVSGKGVAASMLMAQLHALFRSLTQMALPLGQVVTHVNRFFCESTLSGQYATLVCGLAKPTGEVQIHNAGHCPAIVVGHNRALRIEGKLDLLAGGPGGRCRKLRASEAAGGGKSELRRAVCRITSGTWASRPMDGQCHRKDTASATPPRFFSGRSRASLETQYPSWPGPGARSCGNSSAGVRVKWCGKSAPLRR